MNGNCVKVDSTSSDTPKGLTLKRPAALNTARLRTESRRIERHCLTEISPPPLYEFTANNDLAGMNDRKTFLPRHEFGEMMSKTPQQAAQYWTFSDDDVLRMLAINAHLAVNDQYRRLEASGFHREKKSASPTTPPGTTPPSAPAAPALQAPIQRATVSAAPGAASRSTAPADPEVAAFLNTLMPNGARIAGVAG